MSCKAACNPKLMLGRDELRNRIEIGVNAPVPAGKGGYVDAWTPLATVYASIKPMSGRERFFLGQEDTPLLSKVRLRYLPGLTTSHRIKFGERILQILEVLNIEERNVVHELITREDAD